MGARRQESNRGRAGVAVPLARATSRGVRRVYPPLPDRMENRLVFFILNRAHALHAAHVVHAVHSFPPGRGAGTLATPTIASRVTSAASWSSVMFSVPEGRSGRTRYRSSAVLSQTCSSTSSASCSPNSASTPRGSITARDGEGADLYPNRGTARTGQG